MSGVAGVPWWGCRESFCNVGGFKNYRPEDPRRPPGVVRPDAWASSVWVKNRYNTPLGHWLGELLCVVFCFGVVVVTHVAEHKNIKLTKAPCRRTIEKNKSKRKSENSETT